MGSIKYKVGYNIVSLNFSNIRIEYKLNVVFFVYFKKANNSFAEGKLTEDQLKRELDRWANWHWFRTICIVIAFGLSVYGHKL